ncbi:hypothetical protein BJY01DRAFT_153054 [Aspergillus pseudoustus]|uniref:DUF7580 domain-containing protein n=1 Tax=Aspergillus pseudoustus TaxID=1810923 RepID=A0ABR4K986_9EURO
MVTGIEAISMALAVLPLLVNQLDNYAKGLERTRDWRRVRRTFSKYSLDIGTQHTVFLNNLEDLLDGIVDDEDKFRELIKNPQGALWRDSRLQDKLRARLGRSHDVFMGNMVSLHDCLIKLAKRLGVDLSNCFDSAAMPDPQIKMRKMFYRAVYDDFLEDIRKANDTLRTLLEQSPGHKSSKSRPAWSQLLRRFREVRIHAQGLFGAVIRSDHWGCNCKDSHRVHLKLPSVQLMTSDWDSPHHQCRFCVIFSNPGGPSSSAHWTWREVEFEPWKAEAPVATTPTLIQDQTHGSGDRKVRFQESSCVAFTQTLKPMPTVPSLRIVSDICSSLSTSQNTHKRQLLGLLGADPHPCYLMTAIGSHELKIGNRPLRESLQQTSRRDRLRIATGLACGVVQFHGSWLKPNWDISNVQLALGSNATKISPDNLYCTWALTAQPGSTPNDKGKAPALQVRNDILFPLGLALIELSLGQSIDKLRPSNNMPLDELQAKVKEVYDNSGSGYGDVVNNCLFWPPGMASLGFEDARFEERVFNDVVSPLLRELMHFEGY